MPSSISPVASACEPAPPAIQSTVVRADGRRRHAQRQRLDRKERGDERQAEQKAHMRRPRRAQVADEVALHRVPRRLGGGSGEGEDDPG